jgi:transposase
MRNENKLRFTITQFRERFNDDNACLDEIFRLRFGSFTHCPECGNVFKYARVTTISKKDKQQRKAYQCDYCSNQVYPLVGTIYEKSRTPLTYWFYSIYLMISTRNGVAAKELERQLGVTYKTAFRMAHRIRQLMKIKREYYLDGVIQIDEAFVGGSVRFKHNKERAKLRRNEEINDNKIKVLGMISNDATTFTTILKEVSEREILPLIQDKVKPGSIIVTDGHMAYKLLEEKGFVHIVVNHDINEWAKGAYHNNSIEGFWSQLKRTIKGTHIKVSRKYLQKYVDECCFRYEYRKRPSEMFDIMLEKLA